MPLGVGPATMISPISVALIRNMVRRWGRAVSSQVPGADTNLAALALSIPVGARYRSKRSMRCRRDVPF
jgi:hypothetical protein